MLVYPVAGKKDKNSISMTVEEETMRMWNEVFDKLAKADGTDDGQIDRKALVKWVSAMDLEKRIEFEASLKLSRNQLERLVAKVDHNNDGFVDKEEFLELVQNNAKLFSQRQESVFRQYLLVVAYAEEYRWWPPPWFTIVTTIVQIIFFIVERKLHDGYFLPTCSYLIYSPHRRKEIWRFLTYMFVHSDTQHIFFNMSMQLFVGIPLEMSHGSTRVAKVYAFGVVAGSLATTVFDPMIYLAGASGGVYALIAAHLATLVLNWHEDMVILQHRLRSSTKQSAAKLHGPIVRFLRLSIVLLYSAIDTGVAVVRRSSHNISFTAHLSGAIAGLLVGIIVLKNRKVEKWEMKLKICCIVTFALFVGLCLLWNFIGDKVYMATQGINFFPYSKDYVSQANCTLFMNRS